MKNSTLKRHSGLSKDLDGICPKSGESSDLELTGGAVEVNGDAKVNGQGLVMGVGKSDVFDYIKGLK